jgi:hypothetical protein
MENNSNSGLNSPKELNLKKIERNSSVKDILNSRRSSNSNHSNFFSVKDHLQTNRDIESFRFEDTNLNLIV